MMFNQCERCGAVVSVRLRRGALGLALALGLGSAWAQQGAAQPAPAAAAQSQQQQVANQQAGIAPAALLGISLLVVQAIDAVRYRELWSGASPAVRAFVSDVDFVKGVAQLRGKSPGVPTQRAWVRLDLQQQSARPETRSPGGLYATCTFESQFGSTPRREIVSFRLDEDGQWRFAGYNLQ